MNKKKIPALLITAAVCLWTFPLEAAADDLPHLKTSEVTVENDEVLTLDDGQKWYKVNSFEDNNDYVITVNSPSGKEQLLTLSEGEEDDYVWHYYRQTIVPSTYPKISTLSSWRYALVYSDGKLEPQINFSTGSDMYWEHYGSTLRYNIGDASYYLQYDEDSENPFLLTGDEKLASEVSIYTNGDTLERCITGQPAAESYVLQDSGYAAPVFSVETSDVSIDSISWFVDGEKQFCSSLTFKADTLTGRPAGVHHVWCIIEAHDNSGIHYREKSAEAAFVIAKGVLPDSVLTFSDVHEEYRLIGDAIEKVIQKTGGYIPSLIICSGDLINGPTPDTDVALKRYFPQIVSNLGGLDTVFVAGNHDPAQAASIMSAAAGLGGEDTLTADGGLIFNGSSPDVEKNGRNSLSAKGIVVYGINYEAAVHIKDGQRHISYDSVIGDVDSFLKKAAEDYHGELIVISAHSGMHLLGVQPESVNRNDYQLSKWIGENAYNVDMSYELARTINSYAEKYDMDIVYLFGHDHSRYEAELFLTDGDTLISPIKYADSSYGSQPLKFTYAHAGYLSTVIGSAASKFTFFYRDGDKVNFDLMSVSTDDVIHNEVRTKNTFTPSVRTETTTSSATTVAATSNATDSPQTGDDMNVTAIAVPAFIILLLSRKRKGSNI